MADEQEKPSALKQAFQWANAVASMFAPEAPQTGFERGGQIWDYYKAKIGARGAPKTGNG